MNLPLHLRRPWLVPGAANERSGGLYDRGSYTVHHPAEPLGATLRPVSDREARKWAAMNEPVIAAYRRTGGRSRGTHPVLLLTTTGRRTGQPRVTPLNFTLDGERLAVIGSKGGAPTQPAWFLNLLDEPLVTIEHAGETFRARARVAQEPERTRLFDRQAAAMPFFDGYRRRVTAREIPVVVFERLPDADPPG